jgi:carbonic anhydrase
VDSTPTANGELSMDLPRHPSRREFVQQVGVTVGVAGLAQPANIQAAAPTERPNPDEVLQRLIDGNNRFAEGKLLHAGRTPKDFQALAEGQAPLAIVVACADSRVAPEIIFDQGVGDLFVVRVAGNIVVNAGPFVKGSIEYGVAELGTRLILVLGHTQCGAVKAAITHIEANDGLPGSINDLINPIRPFVKAVAGQGGDKLAKVTKANVVAGVKQLEGLNPILAPLVKKGELKVVGGVYQLATGKIEIFR